MARSWVLVILGVLNVALLCSNALLSLSVNRLSLQRSAQWTESAALRAELQRLEVVRARVEDRTDLLLASQNEVKGLLQAFNARHDRSEDGSVAEERGGLQPPKASEAAKETADPLDTLAVPRLTAEEEEHLRSLRAAMPSPPDAVLLQADVDSVLRDPGWNPGAKELSDEERAELVNWLKKYRWFARMAPMERVKAGVLPEVERLRELGAYVEYKLDEPPAAVPGVLISYGENSDKPGYKRIYYLFENDYPDLYHRKHVEQERAFEAYVRIYHLINGSR